MSEMLLAALDRLPARVRRFVVAAGALLALGAVMAALTLTAPRSDHKRRRTPPPPAAASSPRSLPRRLPPPIAIAAMRDARRVAQQFLAGYLPLAYGRGNALAVRGVTSALRRELLLERARLTPVERRRRPRVVSLQMVGTTPAFVVATAVIDDGRVSRTACGSRSRAGRAAGR